VIDFVAAANFGWEINSDQDIGIAAKRGGLWPKRAWVFLSDAHADCHAIFQRWRATSWSLCPSGDQTKMINGINGVGIMVVAIGRWPRESLDIPQLCATAFHFGKPGLGLCPVVCAADGLMEITDPQPGSLNNFSVKTCIQYTKPLVE